MFEPRNPHENTYTKIIKYFSLVMTLLYPALGLFIFFSSDERVRFDPTLKKMLGAVLIIYGIIRAYRVYQQHFKPKKRYRDEE